MTATKEIYRVNLFLNSLFNPDGMHMGAFNEDNSGFMPGNGTFRVVGRNANLLLPELEVGAEYVFRCEVVAEQEDNSTRISIWASGSVQLSNPRQTGTFTIDSPGVIFQPMLPSGRTATISKLMIIDADQWEPLKTLMGEEIPYFDNRTMPLP